MSDNYADLVGRLNRKILRQAERIAELEAALATAEEQRGTWYQDLQDERADKLKAEAEAARSERALELLAWDASVWGSSDPSSPIAASSLDVLAEYRARAEEEHG